MSEIIICSRKECQTTAGCQCSGGKDFLTQVRDHMLAQNEALKVLTGEQFEHEHDSVVDSLRQRVEVLEKALKPFAAAAVGYDLDYMNREPLEGLQAAGELTIGDLRRARSVLEGEKT